MRTKQKVKEIKEEIIEDLPSADEMTVCEDVSDCRLTKQALDVLIADTVYDGREAIYEAVDSMICTIAEDLVGLLATNSVNEDDLNQLDNMIAGVRKTTLIELLRHSADLKTYITSRRHGMEYEFLDVESLTRQAVRLHFPNAFKKWEASDDAQLKKLYADGASWSEISKQMSRNINALKLRAEKLGIASNTGAKARY